MTAPTVKEIRAHAEGVIETLLDYADDRNLIAPPHRPGPGFLELFELRISTRAGRSYGGTKWGKGPDGQRRLIPHVQLGVNLDRGAYYYLDRCRTVEYLASKDPSWTTSRPWQQAIEAAKRGEWMLVEYATLHSHPITGWFVSDDWEDHISAVVAHELAHALTVWRDARTRPHGPEFRAVYEALRSRLGLHRAQPRLAASTNPFC